MVATTLTVGFCLHRHASLDSMREVETVQPLVWKFFAQHLPAFGRTLNGTPSPTGGNEIMFLTHEGRAAVRSRNWDARRTGRRRSYSQRVRCPGRGPGSPGDRRPAWLTAARPAGSSL